MTVKGNMKCTREKKKKIKKGKIPELGNFVNGSPLERIGAKRRINQQDLLSKKKGRALMKDYNKESEEQQFLFGGRKREEHRVYE